MWNAIASSVPEVGNITATAILGWYAWHTASRTIPELVSAFREEMADMRADSRAQRERMLAELAAERLQRHTDHMTLVEGLNALASRLPQHLPHQSSAPHTSSTKGTQP